MENCKKELDASNKQLNEKVDLSPELIQLIKGLESPEDELFIRDVEEEKKTKFGQ